MKGDKSTPEPAPRESDPVRELGRKRLEKFVTLFARALIETDIKTVHDLRVASRRLQQILAARAAQSPAKQAKKVRRFLRGIRQTLGALRNLDVLAQMAAEHGASAASEAARAAWMGITREIEKQRADESSRAQQALADYDLTAFIERTKLVLNQDSADGKIDAGFQEMAGARFQAWSDALSAAINESTPKELHTLRIAGKRLRYLLELQAALSEPKAKALARSLALLQDKLGVWHDSQVLLQFAAAHLRSEEYLANHPGESRALLLDMERDRRHAAVQAAEAVAEAETMRANWPLHPAQKLEN
jgi:CHAD domain-containing protein